MIIGITGTLGAGKGTVVKYLVENKGFTHASARAFFQGQMEKQGIEINRDTMIEFANKLRAEKGPDYVFRELKKQAQEAGGNVVIESLRTPAEANALQDEPNAYLLAVDADKKIRYERICNRGSKLDGVSFDKFLEQEAKEMSGDKPYEQNVKTVMEMADHTIYNDNRTELLYKELEKFLEEIGCS